MQACRKDTVLLQDHTLPSREVANIWEKRGRAFAGQGQDADGFAAYEMALTCAPTDSTLRFAAAYSYSEKGLSALALLHYSAIQNDPKQSGTVMNNIGVALKSVDLPFSSIERYKAAGDKRCGLACANIAQALIAVGFAGEASDWIRKGRETGDDLAALAAAEKRMLTSREGERERLEQTMTEAELVRSVIRELGQVGESDLPAGRYQLASGEELSLSLEGDTAVGTTKEANPVKWTFAKKGMSLDVKQDVGPYGLSRRNGHAKCIGDTIVGFLRPTGGSSTLSAFRASRVAAGAP
jgi:hypothetical protein